MARGALTTVVLAMMLLSVMPLSVSAEDSGGVQASESTVAISPSNPVEGGSATIRLTLYNSNNFEAEDVLYKFYWNGVSSSQLISANTVDIPAQSTADVEIVKSGLTVGEHKVWLAFDYNGAGEQIFFKDIVVTGLADLEATTIETSPTGVKSGDSVMVSTKVSNTGSEDADASRMQIDLGVQSEVLNVPSILAGESAWVNHTMTAPSSGTYDFTVTLDLDDAVIEADEDNLFSSSLVVDERMDVSHLGVLSVDVNPNDLQGPWTISGTLARTGGSGVSEVPMRLEIQDDNGLNVPLPTFYVNISGGENAQQAWTFDLLYSHISSISNGNHEITAAIDPYGTANFIQERTDNDRISSYFDKYQIPDVAVDPYAIPSRNTVNSGTNVDWTVSITNAGDVEVKGRLIYTWEGQTVTENTQPIITIPAGDTYLWENTLPTESGAHTAQFEAQWVPLSNSYDENPQNSYANGSVEVTAQLRLAWSLTSMELVDSDQEPAEFPLMAGDEYTVSIKLSSQETGSVNYSCENELSEVFEEINVVVSTSGQIVTVECTFTASAPYTNINLIPDQQLVSSTQTWNWDSKESSSNVADDAGSMTFQTAGMIAFICVILIAILIAAVILTREVEEEVERDIFDYCPACDGELKGGEDRCPWCSFNLKKARKQFHDCDSCGESIPDLLANCPYCGAEQDVSKYFEQRERRVVEKEEIPLQEEEEIDPETIHAAGYEGFEEAVKEFGYDSDDLEEHWDENIARAEAEVEAAYDRRVAEEEVEWDEEEAMSTVTTTLKSIEETFEGHDIDAILKDKDVKAHTDDGGELTASDADIRGKLYEITGEEGVMPGDEVLVGMGTQDRSLAGNVLPEDAMDFSFDEDADEINPAKAAASENKRRRGVRRRQKKEATAECGACGAEIAVDATECSVCGAKFE
ncbi:MAG: CARDB domain-containing protein [Candidatus Poseidoniaceae archaeon]